MDVCVNLVGQENFVIQTLMNAITLKVHVTTPLKNALIMKVFFNVFAKKVSNEDQTAAVKVNSCSSAKIFCYI